MGHAFPLRALLFPFPVGFCSLNCKLLRKSSQFFCENKTVKQTANNREKNQQSKKTIKRQTLLELLLLKILTIKKKHHPKNHSTLTDVFLKDYHIRYYYTLPQTPNTTTVY